jgi:Ran GTPase-activating protein (RanGAP) involved in mRNA processing and transport
MNLSEQNLTDEDMEIVMRDAIINKQCEELDLSKNNISSVGASIIAEALNNNTTLKILYLRRNRLDDIGVRTIAKILSLNNCKLGMLDLQSVGMTNEGAEYLAEMLKKNTQLVRLLLSNNEIDDRGVQRLANVLTHHNNTLKTLRIDGNESISDRIIDSLIEMLKHNPTLTCLDIEECNLSKQGKERLRQIAKSKKGFELTV